MWFLYSIFTLWVLIGLLALILYFTDIRKLTSEDLNGSSESPFEE